MSLSNLGAQLAHLNSSSSAYTSSKRKEDALGRGQKFSRQTGHALQHKNTQNKASIFQTSNSRDQPFTTLQQAAYTSLTNLATAGLLTEEEDLTDFTSLVDEQSVSFERGMQTADENARIDEVIVRLLHVLSVALLDEKISALHLLEYLVARYDIHARPNTVQKLLQCLLPHYGQQYFVNVLKLVDLANLDCWYFLRPFVILKEENSIPFDVFVKQASKDTRIVMTVCELCQIVNSKYKNPIGTTGVVHLCQFACNLLLETFGFQSAHQLQGSVSENLILAVLPFIENACQKASGCPEYRFFGYTTAAALSSHTTLSSKVKDKLAAAILSGATVMDHSFIRQGLGESKVALNHASDAILAAMSLFLRGRKTMKDAKELKGLKIQGIRYGCSLSKKLCKSLLKHRLLDQVLLDLREGVGLDVLPIVCCFLARSIENMSKSDEESLIQLLSTSVVKSIWNNELGEAITFEILVSFISILQEKGDVSGDIINRYKSSIKQIKEKDQISFESGLGQCISGLPQDTLLKAVELLDLSPSSLKVNQEMNAKVNLTTHVLPIRLALAHDDVSVRLSAVSRLSDELNKGETEVNDSVRLLLHTLSLEDSESVAFAIVAALKVIEVEGFKGAKLISVPDALRMLQRWGSFSVLHPIKSSDTGDRKEVARTCLKFCHLIDDSLQDGATEQLGALLRIISAHQSSNEFFDSSVADDEMITTLAKTLMESIIGNDNAFSNDSYKSMIQNICNGTNVKNDTENQVNCRALWNALNMFKESFETSSDQVTQLCLGIQVAVFLLDSTHENLVSPTKEILLQVFKKAPSDVIKSAVTNETLLNDLISPKKEDTYEKAFKPVLEMVVKAVQIEVNTCVALIQTAKSLRSHLKRIIDAIEFQISGGSFESFSKSFLPLFAISSEGDAVQSEDVTLLINLISRLDKIVSTKNKDVKLLVSYFVDIFSKGEKNSIAMNRDLFKYALANLNNHSKARNVAQSLLDACSILLTDVFDNFELYGELFEDALSTGVYILLKLGEAGEATFPLQDRWDHCGEILLNKALVNSKSIAVVQTIAQMLKGVQTSAEEGTSISIVTGPSRRGRARSYSIGLEETSYIRPYPDNMVESIIYSLTLKEAQKDMVEILIDFILCSKSWATHVFERFDEKKMCQIFDAVFKFYVDHDSDIAASALGILPMSAGSLIHLFNTNDSLTSNEEDQVGLLLIVDCIRHNERLKPTNEEAQSICSALFKIIRRLSGESSVSNNTDYIRASLISSVMIILNLISRNSSGQQVSAAPVTKTRGRPKRGATDTGKFNEEVCTSLTDLLVELLGGVKQSGLNEVVPLKSDRARAVAVDALVSLSNISHETVIPLLLPALRSVVSGSKKMKRLNPESLTCEYLDAVLEKVVPMFCNNASFHNLSELDLIKTLLADCFDNSVDVIERSIVPMSLIKSLKTLSSKSASLVMMTIIATEAFNAIADGDSVPADSILSEVVMDGFSPVDNAQTLLEVIKFTTKMLQVLSNDLMEDDEDESDTNVLTALINIVMRGLDDSSSRDIDQERASKLLTTNLLLIIRHALKNKKLQRFVRKAHVDSIITLELWQELMLLESEALAGKSKDDFASASIQTVQESLNILQSHLPAPQFLAAVSSIVSDSAADDGLRRRAVRVLGDRVTNIEPQSAEAALFIEMVPDITKLLSGPSRDETSARNTVMMQQTVLIFIEKCITTFAADNSTMAVFVPVMSKVCELISSSLMVLQENSSISKESVTVELAAHLLGSSVLCASSLACALKKKVLPMLRKLVTSMIDSMELISKTMEINYECPAHAKFVVKSLIRGFIVVINTLPQYLGTQMKVMLSPSSLLSSKVRAILIPNESSTISFETKLDDCIARTPARLVIPSLCDATITCFDENTSLVKEGQISLKILEKSISLSTRNELSALTGKIFSAVTICFSKGSTTVDILNSANNTLLALIMKLSEKQLRPLYARLREWRGSTDDETFFASSSLRRYAFWNLTSLLCEKLRGIFLPCMTSILPDVTKELEYFVSELCHSHSKSSDGSKRQKLRSNSDSYDMESLKSLQPILLCLEASLKADAHEGGDWIRSDNGKHFNMLLRPLGKLFLAKLPSSFPFNSPLDSDHHIYDRIARGSKDVKEGNIKSCMVALAAAAGNEQLWKPLNNEILEACAHESRQEVRKAGISTLLAILQSLGEEYFVLLPECLPVLSELLEDSNQEIVSMTKECIRLGEEVLGESLDDNL